MYSILNNTYNNSVGGDKMINETLLLIRLIKSLKVLKKNDRD